MLAHWTGVIGSSVFFTFLSTAIGVEKHVRIIRDSYLSIHA